jgi:predicted DNA-binding protein
MLSSTTCLRISRENRERLNSLKRHPKESYDEVIGRILNHMTDPEPLTEEDLSAIEQSLDEIREGRYYTLDQIKAQLKTDNP